MAPAPPSGIDLHAHTTASDGTDRPAQLMAAAVAAGLTTVAITDHDTTAGWAEAAAARPAGLALVRGAEFSCQSPSGRAEDPRPVSVHLLGYLFDPDHPAIVEEQHRLRTERASRLSTMVARMAADGYPVDQETVAALLPEGASAGRPHLARALVAAGVVGSVAEAFARLLHDTSPYYVPRQDTPARRAVGMIRDAGGVVVFAHPLARGRGRVVETSVIVDLIGAGLAGLEVDHPDHAEPDRVALRALADRHGVLATGSSDYHGTNKTVRLGDESTDPAALAALTAAATGIEVLGG